MDFNTYHKQQSLFCYRSAPECVTSTPEGTKRLWSRESFLHAAANTAAPASRYSTHFTTSNTTDILSTQTIHKLSSYNNEPIITSNFTTWNFTTWNICFKFNLSHYYPHLSGTTISITISNYYLIIHDIVRSNKFEDGESNIIVMMMNNDDICFTLLYFINKSQKKLSKSSHE